MVSPVGDQIGPETSMGSLVKGRASPPSTGKSQTWLDPLRVEMKAMVLPSGLQRGWLSVPVEVVSRFGSPPADRDQVKVAVRLLGRAVQFRDIT